MNFSATHAWVLWLLPLALLPLLFHNQTLIQYSSLLLLPKDRLSDGINVLIRLLAIATILLLLLGLSGLFRPPQTIERIGQGAQMVLLLDRSSSMDRPFAGSGANTPRLTAARPGRSSKGYIARKLLSEFVARRNQDMFGMLVFSTHPIQVIPLTDEQKMIQAAIEAGNIGRGLAKTNLGDGLIKALEFFEDKPYTGSRIVMLVSDGGARLDPTTQDHINNLTQRHRVALYWIYIRTKNSPGLDTKLDLETAREIAPEQLLHQFFQDLAMPYRAYSAENPEVLQQAIDDVNRLQNLPIRYQSVIPKQDLSGWCYGIALMLLILLLLAKLIEIKTMARKQRLTQLLLIIAVICVFALISEIRQQHYVKRFNNALQQQEWEKASQYDESYGLFAEAYGLQQNGEFNEAIKRYGTLESNENADLRQAAKYNLANTYLHWALSVDLETDNDIALPLVELAKQTYRGLLKENPWHWDAKYNLERALQLFPDIQEAAIQEWQAPENSPRSLATFRADRDLP